MKQEERNFMTKDDEQTVIRPWGYFTNLAEQKNYLVKVIHVNAGQQLSVQSHNYRSEHWLVTKGVAKVLLGDNEFNLSVGESIDIPVKAIHSLQNPSENPIEIIEVQLGEILSEDDITRYKDIYGRA